MRAARSLAATGAMLAALLCTQAAGAQSRDPAAAQALFDEGVKLKKANDWAGACQRFEASFKLDPSVGTQINLAQCAEHDGKIASAWAQFKTAKVLNRETPGAQRKKEVDTYLDGEVARLEPRLPWITVKVASPPEGLRVERDGTVIPVEGLGQGIPIDPGKHVIVASAPGFITVTKEVQIAEGKREEVQIELQIDPNAKKADPVVPPGTPPVKPKPEDEGPGALVIAGAVVGGVGALSLIAAAITGGLAMSEHGKVEDLTGDGGECEVIDGAAVCASAEAQASANDSISKGETLALTSTVTLFAGAAVAATGLTLILVGVLGDSDDKGAEVSVVPVISPDVAGIVIGGSF